MTLSSNSDELSSKGNSKSLSSNSSSSSLEFVNPTTSNNKHVSNSYGTSSTSIVDGNVTNNNSKNKDVNNTNGMANSVITKLSSANTNNGLDNLKNGSVMVNGTKINSNSGSRRQHKRVNLEDTPNLLEVIKSKDDQIWKLESNNQRLKVKLQTSELCQSDLRQQLNLSQSSEKNLKSTIAGLQSDIEQLQKKLQSFQQWKATDKSNIQRLEKLLEDEKKRAKVSNEAQVASEKKAKMAEDAAARANAIAEAVRNVCSESCRLRQREVELEISNLRKDLVTKEEQLKFSAKVIKLEWIWIIQFNYVCFFSSVCGRT